MAFLTRRREVYRLLSAEEYLSGAELDGGPAPANFGGDAPVAAHTSDRSTAAAGSRLFCERPTAGAVCATLAIPIAVGLVLSLAYARLERARGARSAGGRRARDSRDTSRPHAGAQHPERAGAERAAPPPPDARTRVPLGLLTSVPAHASARPVVGSSPAPAAAPADGAATAGAAAAPAGGPVRTATSAVGGTTGAEFGFER